MTIKSTAVFETVCTQLPADLARTLRLVPPEIRQRCIEVRLRSGSPLCLFDGLQSIFIGIGGDPVPASGGMVVDTQMVQEALIMLCGYSLHTFSEELKKGFITTRQGIRVGVCLEKPVGNTTILPISLAIRLAREVIGAALPLLQSWDCDRGLILAGPPAAGKTTVLRDLIRLVSSGADKRPPQKVVVLDERLEITGLYRGSTPFFLGPCTDILPGMRKREAIEQAVRTLSPQIIFCDEIASPEEIEEIEYAFACGVKFVVTVHCGGEQDFLQNWLIHRLISTNCFSRIALLQNPVSGNQFKAVMTDAEYRLQSPRFRAGAGV